MKQELYEQGREIVLNAPQLYVDVDVEADGIAGYGSMLAIGAQSPTGESFKSEIRPITDKFVQRQRDFCESHGLERSRLLREAPTITQVMPEFHAWVKDLEKKYDKKPVLTAFGADFDTSFVKQYHALTGLYDDYPFALMPLDLKSLALPLGYDWDYNETSKAELPPEIIPEGDFTHDPLEDAQYQQQIHFGMAAKLGRLSYYEVAGQRYPM